VIAEALSVERVGRSQRAKAIGRRSRIDHETRQRIRALASDGWSLRAIARELGVSQESVRQVLAAVALSVEA
jgi:hypothetical protein